MLKLIPADERAPEIEERLMYVCTPLVADAQLGESLVEFLPGASSAKHRERGLNALPYPSRSAPSVVPSQERIWSGCSFDQLVRYITRQ